MKQAVHPPLLVYDDYDAMSGGARDFFMSRVGAAVGASGRASVALSGGSTPRGLYTLLASLGPGGGIEWSRVHFFWADERCVPPDNAESNYKLAWDAFLSRIPAGERNIHRIRGEAGATEAGREYERELRSFFANAPWPVFDLILLGVGADGHTASLFPDSAALAERRHWVIPLHRETPGRDRVTLSLDVLTHGREVVFLAAGREKASILHEILEDGNPRRRPAGLVTPKTGAVTWILDREAAKLLSV